MPIPEAATAYVEQGFCVEPNIFVAFIKKEICEFYGEYAVVEIEEVVAMADIF